MLIFVSAEALKSGWTFFEAGYGLHKLNSANIYCLPGTDKAALPSPFNILQNRNLHSAREASLLIRQINQQFGSTLAESITKDEFDGVFKKPMLGQIETGPSFHELAESVKVKSTGPCDSIDIFLKACRAGTFPVSNANPGYGSQWDERCSTGVRLLVETPEPNDQIEEFVITDEFRKAGSVRIRVLGERWVPDLFFSSTSASQRSISEIEAYNAKVRTRNEKIRDNNEQKKTGPRACRFFVSPINISVPIGIIDAWHDEVHHGPETVEIKLKEDVTCERRSETISAKIHGSTLTLSGDGSLVWEEHINLRLASEEDHTLTLTAMDSAVKNLSRFRIQDLLITLFGTNILSFPPGRAKRKR